MVLFYSYFKAFHIVGFVSWFAGLFYLVRMFVYYAEVKSKPLALQEDWKKQFTLMQWRVYKIIINPAMMFTWTFGLLMLFTNPDLLLQTWIKVKLVLLLVLVAYQLYCKKIIKDLELGRDNFGSYNFRLLNEIPTLFLVAIVLLAVVRDFINFLYLFGGVLAFGFVLFMFVKWYKKLRES